MDTWINTALTNHQNPSSNGCTSLPVCCLSGGTIWTQIMIHIVFLMLSTRSVQIFMLIAAPMPVLWCVKKVLDFHKRGNVNKLSSSNWRDQTDVINKMGPNKIYYWVKWNTIPYYAMLLFDKFHANWWTFGWVVMINKRFQILWITVYMMRSGHRFSGINAFFWKPKWILFVIFVNRQYKTFNFLKVVRQHG